MSETRKTSGRPTRLTPDIQAKILQAVRSGSYRNVAAGYAGVPVRTVENWLALGRKGESKVHVEFLSAIEQAENEAEIRHTLILCKAGETDWRASLAYLERKFSERWGRKEHRTVDQTVKNGDQPPQGQGFSVEWLGVILAPYPEAKAAVGAAIQALIEERKKKQIEDKQQ